MAMAFMNEGTWDRVVRILAGVALGYAAWTTWPASVMSRPGAVSIAFLAIGAIAFVTGLVGWCPAYALFDVSTKKRVGA
jgi:CHASE2 domain-containing sensor protein